MTIPVYMQDGGGSGARASVLPMNVGGAENGMLVQTERYLKFDTTTIPFLNEIHGANMAQDASAGGVPEIIHDGGTSSAWDATAVQGSWNFADSGKISISSASDNDEAKFDDSGGGSVDLGSYVSVSGKVTLTTYNVSNNDIILSFGLAGVLAGNAVNLEDYIDIGDTSEQSFAIPLLDFGASTATIDEFVIHIDRAGGARPTLSFDDIQIEQTGGSLIYTARPPKGERMHVAQIRYAFADNISIAQTNGTAYGLSYDKILGVNALTAGIGFKRIVDEKTKFNVLLKDISDFITSGAVIDNAMDDTTNTYLSLSVDFPEPLILDGNLNDRMTLTISDDLSGLLLFKSLIRGALGV
jgi:hypothetical protein